MIADILLSWNELTITLVGWLSVVSLVVGADFGPEVYREKKARKQLVESLVMLAEEKAAIAKYREHQIKKFEETMPLFVIKRPVTQTKRRHAKVAA